MEADEFDVSENRMWALLDYSKETFITNYTVATTPTKASVENEEGMVRGQDPLIHCKLLNRLSKLVWDGLAQPAPDIITFCESKSGAFRGHPKTTEFRPDIIAIAHPAGQKPPSEPWHWSALEAAGVFETMDPTESDSAAPAQGPGVLCTGYLLQARPDLISALGVAVDSQYFKLFLSNALGVFSTEPLPWDEPSSIPLLCAWISRLYAPNIDSSMERINSPEAPIFNVTVGVGESGEVYKGCSIHKAGGPFGRRTLILKPENSDVVIKEQYVDPMREFQEGPMLEKVHFQKPFPGVVRIQPCDAAQSSQDNVVLKYRSYEKEKTRLVMLDKAEPLMDAETVWEALIAFYDLLEVTRFLYTKRKILHRDISSGNVLLRSEPPPDLAFSDDLESMCFASYLLQQEDCVPKNKRLETRVLLIDFDASQDCDAVNSPDEEEGRTGTMPFMARAVGPDTSSEYMHLLPAMPHLGEGKARYKESIGERLEAFPENETIAFRVRDHTPLRKFQHKFHYDAESVFWLLLYWCLVAKPSGKLDRYPSDGSVPHNVWTELMSANYENDFRSVCLILSYPKRLCHPTYELLGDLLKDMATHLEGDLGLVNETPKLAEQVWPAKPKEDHTRGKDEYLHEVFQRLILNFLFKHRDAPFMKEKQSQDRLDARTAPWWMRQSSSIRSEVSESQFPRPQKRKRDDVFDELRESCSNEQREKKVRLE